MDVPSRESLSIAGHATSSPRATRNPRLAAGLLLVTLLLVGVILAACNDPDDRKDGVLRLPTSLHELSGMVALDADTPACVQDESGIVYLVDLRGEKPLRSVSFGKDGDYEGIAAVGDVLWVLRSDGKLYRLIWEDGRLKVDQTYKLPLQGEFEGLCYDAAHSQLLVLPKGPVDGKRREQERRHILSFDLQRQVAVDKPFLTLKVDEIEQQIEARSLPAPSRTTAKGNRRVELQLYGSELLVLANGDLLLLSPKDHLLLRLDRSGNVVATMELDMERLPQPEAMALLPNGQLLVGSEGRDGPAKILVVAIPR